MYGPSSLKDRWRVEGGWWVVIVQGESWGSGGWMENWGCLRERSLRDSQPVRESSM